MCPCWLLGLCESPNSFRGAISISKKKKEKILNLLSGPLSKSIAGLVFVLLSITIAMSAAWARESDATTPDEHYGKFRRG